MKRKNGFTAMPMPKNWVRALYIIWKRKLRKMNHDVIIALVAIIILILQMFIIVTAVNAQDRPKGLQIGDKVPDVTITNILNHPTGTAQISDFKGKLLILDFWATWCAPCVAMIPKMDSLQKRFDGRVQFLSVTYQSEREVTSFLKKLENQKKKRFTLPTAVGNSELKSLFPHSSLPHYVWIDQNGIIKAITGHEKVNAVNLLSVLNGVNSGFAEKKDAQYTYRKNEPMLLAGNGGDGTEIRFYSVLTGFLEKVPAGFDVFVPAKDGSRRITARNLSLADLYKLAYYNKSYFGDNRVVLQVTDPSAVMYRQELGDSRSWYRKNSYCYDLIVPVNMAADIKTKMQEDLRNFFNSYSASVELLKRKYLAMVKTSDHDKIRSAGGPSQLKFDATGCTLRNRSFKIFTSQLADIYLQNSPLPLMDETGYKGNVDITIEANLSSIPHLNEELKKYDLKIVEKEGPIEMLVIRDRNR